MPKLAAREASHLQPDGLGRLLPTWHTQLASASQRVHTSSTGRPHGEGKNRDIEELRVSATISRLRTCLYPRPIGDCVSHLGAEDPAAELLVLRCS